MLACLFFSPALNAMENNSLFSVDVKFYIERNAAPAFSFLCGSARFPANVHRTYRLASTVHNCQATNPTIIINNVARIITIHCTITTPEQNPLVIKEDFNFDSSLTEKELSNDWWIGVTTAIHPIITVPPAIVHNNPDLDR